MGEEEAQAEKEIIAKYKEWKLYRYDPSIKYEPLKQFDVPRFVVSPSLTGLTQNLTHKVKAQQITNRLFVLVVSSFT